ncbi:hypothetical protein B0H12DRAFT_1123022 [Mycena haematopus]|nr:hypothetical protein B0H12DRAFT_1123022 [Mycena haematopus]
MTFTLHIYYCAPLFWCAQHFSDSATLFISTVTNKSSELRAVMIRDVIRSWGLLPPSPPPSPFAPAHRVLLPTRSLYIWCSTPTALEHPRILAPPPQVHFHGSSLKYLKAMFFKLFSSRSVYLKLSVFKLTFGLLSRSWDPSKLQACIFESTRADLGCSFGSVLNLHPGRYFSSSS